MRCAGEGWLGNGRSKLLQVSFRLRLTLFFLLIVVLPMVALAVLVVQISADSESGKADARLSAGLRTATTVYEQAQADSRRVAGEIAADVAADPAAVAALEGGDRATLRALADELAADVVALRIANDARRRGDRVAIPVGGRRLGRPDRRTGGRSGSVTVSTIELEPRCSTRIERGDGRGRGAGRARRADRRHGLDRDRRAARGRRSGDARRAARGSCGWPRPSRSATSRPAGRALRPAGRRGLPLLAARRSRSRWSLFLLLALAAIGLLLRRPQGQIKEMLARRTADRQAATSPARSRSAATMSWRDWRASSTR